VISKLFAVQVFRDDKWQTLYLCSGYAEAADVFDECYAYPEPVRLVWYKVDGVDFVATYARDFRVLDSHA
jgi:hypothetical protein